jgi:hypothetical protein
LNLPIRLHLSRSVLLTFKISARREDFSSVSRYRVFATVWFFPFSLCLGGEFPAVLWLRLRRAGFIGLCFSAFRLGALPRWVLLFEAFSELRQSRQTTEP